MLKSIFALSYLCVFTALGATAALAAPNLEVQPWQGNMSPQVETTYQYTTTVRNIGNQTAQGVVLTINFPVTSTSPNTYILGKLIGALPTGCTLALPPNRTKVTCNLGNMSPNTIRPITFGFQFQVASITQSLTATAAVTTGNEQNPNNNSASMTPTLTYPDNIATNARYLVTSCTGRGLTSFYECEITPGSTQSRLYLDFNLGGTMYVQGSTSFIGYWDQATLPDKSLHINIPAEIDFNGFAVSSDCFEGITTFPNNPTYNSAYRVCMQ